MPNHAARLSPHVRNPDRGAFASAAYGTTVGPVPEIDIAKRAYEKYEARGCAHGFDLQDWANASRELTAETFEPVTNSPSLCPSQYAS